MHDPTGPVDRLLFNVLGMVAEVRPSYSPCPWAPRRSIGRYRPLAMTTCTHLDQVLILEPPDDIAGCEECLKAGDRWLHLRMCQTCGKIGCCDSSPNRHASGHAREAGHPVLRSVQPGEDWSWCAVDDAMFVLHAE